MELISDKEIFKQVHKLAVDRNVSDREVLEEAIIIYQEYLKLIDEFKMWDNISDKDFLEFKNRYGHYIN